MLKEEINFIKHTYAGIAMYVLLTRLAHITTDDTLELVAKCSANLAKKMITELELTDEDNE